jgi:hypothetical protein
MITARAKPTRRPLRPQPTGEIRHDPAGLSATLRDLAARAHRAVRAAQAEGPSVDSQRELMDLHARIVQLQRNLQAQSLEGLVPYVAALGREVSALIIRH